MTYEIDKLVRSSHQGKRVPPPTIRKVLIQVTTVYLFALFMSFMMVLPVPHLPYFTLSMTDVVRVPVEAHPVAGTTFGRLPPFV